MNAPTDGVARRRHRSRAPKLAVTDVGVRSHALWALAGVLLLATVWLLPEAFRQLRSDLAAGAARGATTRIGTPRPLTTEEDWQTALDSLERAVSIAPDDASAQADLGALYGSASLRADISAEQRGTYVVGARLHDQVATRLRPTEPRGWAELARAQLLAGDAGPAYVQAWELAAALGPQEASLHGQLFDFVVATYPKTHNEQMSLWLRTLFKASKAERQESMRRAAATYNIQITPDGRLFLPMEFAADR